MPKHRFAALALIVSVVTGTAGAQITLVPGPALRLSQGLDFLAAADFNGDGRADVAVGSAISDTVTIAFGGKDGSFASVANVPVGDGTAAIAAGDLNGDGHPDFVVASHLHPLLFVVSGNGDGTFNSLMRFEVSATPDDVAIGNFDGKNGNDLVSVGQSSDQATVLLNSGGNLGFASAGDVPTGHQPRRVVAADLNGDAVDDIVTLTTGSSDTDTISVLLNTGAGSFSAPLAFAAGGTAQDLAVTDINNDGAPDILVLNGTTGASPNMSSVSVFLNRTAALGSRMVGMVGTGYFDAAPPVMIPCPSTIGGIPVACAPRSIAAADLNGDGLTDFAVASETVPQTGMAAGLLFGFEGLGDGSFHFATEIIIDSAPNRLVAADFNCDAMPDLAVTEDASQAVQTELSIPPPPLTLDGCNVDSQCLSGFCVDHVCRESACLDGQLCNVPGSEGQCHVPLATPAVAVETGGEGCSVAPTQGITRQGGLLLLVPLVWSRQRIWRPKLRRVLQKGKKKGLR